MAERLDTAQINKELATTVVELSALAAIVDPVGRSTKAVEIGRRRKELLGLLGPAAPAPDGVSIAEPTVSGYQLEAPKEAVLDALSIFINNPQVDMAEIIQKLGKMRNNRDYQPQNVYFALKRAVGVIAYRIDSKINTPPEKEIYEKIQEFTGEEDFWQADQRMQASIKDWYFATKETTTEQKAEVEEVETFEVTQIEKEKAKILGGMLLTHDGVDITFHGQVLTTFTLPPEIKAICEELSRIPITYRNIEEYRNNLPQLRAAVITEVASIIEGERLAEIDKQKDPRVQRLLTWNYVDAIDELRGKFFQFLKEEPKRPRPIDLGGGVVDPGRRYWELPNGQGSPPIPPRIWAQAPTLAEVADHPLVISPEQKVEQPSQELPQVEPIDYTWIKYHPLMVSLLETLPKRTRILLEDFLDYKAAGWILDEIRKFDSKDEAEIKDFSRRLSGSIFEQLSYLHIKKEHVQNDLTVVSPEQVHMLWRAMYPDRAIIRNGPFSIGIDGISYPDGLILRETKNALMMISLLEYKLWTVSIPDPQDFESQLTAFKYQSLSRSFRIPRGADKLMFTRALQEAGLKIPDKPFILTKDYTINYFLPGLSQIEISDPDVTVDYVPISGGNFRSFSKVLTEILGSGRQLEEKIEDALNKVLAEEVEEEPADQHPRGEPAREDSDTPRVEKITAEPQEKVQKTPLERRDPGIEENIQKLVKEAFESIPPKGLPIEIFRTKGFFRDLNREIKNRTIRPESVKGHVVITRRDFVIVNYLNTVMKNKPLSRNLLGDLEKLIDVKIAQHEAEIIIAQALQV